MREWATDATCGSGAVSCQLKAKTGTDPDLPTYASSPEWMNRSSSRARETAGRYATTDPGWARTFVRAQPNLSPLSKREATKHF